MTLDPHRISVPVALGTIKKVSLDDLFTLIGSLTENDPPTFSLKSESQQVQHDIEKIARIALRAFVSDLDHLEATYTTNPAQLNAIIQQELEKRLSRIPEQTLAPIARSLGIDPNRYPGADFIKALAAKLTDCLYNCPDHADTLALLKSNQFLAITNLPLGAASGLLHDCESISDRIDALALGYTILSTRTKPFSTVPLLTRKHEQLDISSKQEQTTLRKIDLNPINERENELSRRPSMFEGLEATCKQLGRDLAIEHRKHELVIVAAEEQLTAFEQKIIAYLERHPEDIKLRSRMQRDFIDDPVSELKELETDEDSENVNEIRKKVQVALAYAQAKDGKFVIN